MPADGAADDGGTARRCVGLARDAGLRVAVAESLTAGLVAARLADVPGASAVLRGGVVAYATDVKASVLGVPEDLLARTGPVDADVARAMADGVRALLGADVGVATTGVAGPGPADGHAAGTAHVAVTGAAGEHAEELHLPGDRAAVRAGVAGAALRLLATALEGDDRPAPRA